MTDTPPYAELLALIDDRSTAFRDAVTAAADLQARVPGCPEWALADLVAHLGRVQRFWALVVAMGDDSRPPSPGDRGDTSPHGDLLAWSAESTHLLLGRLRDTEPDAPCWTWWGTSGAPMTAGAIARHQVQEAAVHAFDAQQTIGKPEPLPAAVAVDGVPEFLGVTLGSQGAWPHQPARVAFAATDGPTRTVDLSPSGATLDPAASGEPVATVHAPASDLVLALYGRLPFDGLRVEGDHTVLSDIRTWSDTN
jgi:uncharacterized protein (TIGR03083 family)